MEPMTLDDLKIGECGKVVKIIGSGVAYRKILDMGVVKGTLIEIKRVAPMGDPIMIKVKGYYLSLRKSEASGIYVERETI